MDGPSARCSAYRRTDPRPAEAPGSECDNGIDVLVQEKFPELQGKRVGLITNHTGITRDGRRNIDAMIAGGRQSAGTLFARTRLAGRKIRKTSQTQKMRQPGFRVWSLYSGQNRQANRRDAARYRCTRVRYPGCRRAFLHVSCTMANAMQEAAKRNIEFVVLDRPNPINGIQVEGPVLDPSLKSFIGCFELPLRHGMTIGELATMMNDSSEPKAKLQVVKMRGWQRSTGSMRQACSGLIHRQICAA